MTKILLPKVPQYLDAEKSAGTDLYMSLLVPSFYIVLRAAVKLLSEKSCHDFHTAIDPTSYTIIRFL